MGKGIDPRYINHRCCRGDEEDAVSLTVAFDLLEVWQSGYLEGW